MKKCLWCMVLLIAMLQIGVNARAQHFHADAILGFNLSQIEGDELKGFKQFGLNVGIGTTVYYGEMGLFATRLEVLLSQRGSFNNTGDPYSTNIWLPYIDIPVMMQYRDPRGGMTFGVGLAYGRLVQQPHNVMALTKAFIPDTTDMAFLKNDLGVVAELQFPIWKALSLNIRWQRSIIAIKKDWHFTEISGTNAKTWSNDCYNQSLSLRLIYEL